MSGFIGNPACCERSAPPCHVQQTTSNKPRPTNHVQQTTTTTILFVLVAIQAAIFVVPTARAQTTITLGTIAAYGDPAPCPTNFYSGMTCVSDTINCSNVDSHVDNINVTIGYVTQATTPKGTIVFFTGGGGTASDFGPTNSFADYYVGTYMIVYVEWASDWEKSSSTASNRNILSAACRPATLLKLINDSTSTFHPNGAMCAQGSSAGSAAIAYSMSWYGLDQYLTNVELLAGPVLTEIDQGCLASPPSPTMCNGQSWCQTSLGSQGWTTSAGYTSDKQGSINTWAGISDCGSILTGSSELTRLAHMSIIGGSYGSVTGKYSFATAKRHGWVCAGGVSNYYQGTSDCYIGTGTVYCPNNSSPEGWYWYNQASDNNMLLTGTNTCKGTGTGQNLYSTEAEGVADGVDPISDMDSSSERNEIEEDMNAKCQ